MICVNMAKNLPKPIASRRYSGKFMVRVPPEVHRDLAIQAAEAGISLNGQSEVVAVDS